MTAQTFFRELNRLLLLSPKTTPHIFNSENCDYGDHIYYSKNLYFAFDCLKCSDSSYIYDATMSAHCIDCDYSEASELCYECVDIHKCYNSQFLEHCSNVQDSSYSSKCVDSHDIFGCVLLTNKSFCIFNRQLTEAEYKHEVQKYKAWPREKIFAIVEELKKQYPLTQTNELHNENASYGNYVYYSKNCYFCFDTSYSQDCGYNYNSLRNTFTYDSTYSVENEQSYEMINSSQNSNSKYVLYSAHCRNSSYMVNCYDVNNSLGCVGLSRKEYCILNRQYTKDDYERISEQILTELRNKNLGWGTLTS